VKPLRFLHIPKTAGSTFKTILKRQYPHEKCFEFTGNYAADLKSYNELSENDRNAISIFMGHAPIETGISNADNAVIITFLRDPISRVKSFCQHVYEGKSPHLIDKYPPEGFDLDALLESGNQELSNIQTRFLIDRWGCPSELRNNLSDSEAINTAVDNLFNKISYFGIQEYFDKSLIYYSAVLNWKMPFYISENTRNTKKLLQFDNRHIKRIAELNSLDLEVYRIAEDKFSLLAFNKAKLKWFQFVNAQLPFIMKSRQRFIGVTRHFTSR